MKSKGRGLLIVVILGLLVLSATVLSSVGRASDQTVGVLALTKRLKDDDAGFRSLAAYALGQLGPAARDAVPDLTEALQDSNHKVRSSSAYALGLALFFEAGRIARVSAVVTFTQGPVYVYRTL